LDDGKVRLFALFDPKNHIVSNVEYDVPKNRIAQMYGNGVRTGNTDPTNYVPQMVNLIQDLKVKELSYDAEKFLEKANAYKAPMFRNDRDQYLFVTAPESRKHGGLVERNTNDDRRYL
jgi:hypothetical protein